MTTGGPSPEDQETIRALLDADRRETTARVEILRRDWDEIVESAGQSPDDEHDPEGSSTAFERAHVQSLRDQALAHLADLDRALDRLADGSYGRCASCGRPIAPERLTVRPATTTCVSCASRRR
ncbi:TraR/DksA C4-type zinc finger protein [Nonomuraea sp. NBC_01738]|uniref:TraR/DksA family transcriptional regulator n=1 Tax=Nonomuraea sp. NBC_01738 TaxID=2976003 RepID=UPI002E0DC720|nr:TraR/DksA C4-type zinc finger protein [Nonomuraea sp. NBC_01738]